MDALRLDGNAAAGILREVFATDVTTAVGTCAGCGATDAVGSVHVYVSAGIVLRCPSCDAVLIRLVHHEAHLDRPDGLRSLELERR